MMKREQMLTVRGNRGRYSESESELTDCADSGWHYKRCT